MCGRKLINKVLVKTFYAQRGLR